MPRRRPGWPRFSVRKHSRAFPDLSTEQLTYDANGNVLTLTKRDGSVITTTYNQQTLVATKQ